ncbi:thioredoxin family protein [Pelomonas sp. SE-A7]|uniref:thioredoxin family protein n=1 Tax=Pelomonas sp. SE-A7 TaxID=3054953 RepID=UPI00259CABDE|nr:thioredoxin family protein [Pelomonas sp. SE-A7]MDM4767141.1 thioredoxin family protein [Pelomonas sp. SE-A7]
MPKARLTVQQQFFGGSAEARRPGATFAQTMTATPAPLVACLCAAWCRVCDSYHEVFAELRARYPATRFVWVDIEEDEELIGDLEVETFPTLLVGLGSRLQFLGPITPQLATAERLLTSLAEAPATAAAPPSAQALLARLQQSCS